jgi:chromate transporter
LIVLVLAWLYVQYGTTPQLEWLMYGIKPVVIAIIAQALWMLGSKAFKNKLGLIAGITFLFFTFWASMKLRCCLQAASSLC